MNKCISQATWHSHMSSMSMNLVREELKVMRPPISSEDWDTSADSESYPLKLHNTMSNQSLFSIDIKWEGVAIPGHSNYTIIHTYITVILMEIRQKNRAKLQDVFFVCLFVCSLICEFPCDQTVKLTVSRDTAVLSKLLLPSQINPHVVLQVHTSGESFGSSDYYNAKPKS